MQMLVSIVVYIPLNFNWVDGALFKQKVAMAHSQPHCPEPIFGSNEGAIRMSSASPHAWLPCLKPLQLGRPASQSTRHHNHPPGYNQPTKTTQHTQPTQKSLIYKITFHTKRENNHIEKTGELRELSGNCGNSLESEEPVSTILYVPVHLGRVDGSSVQVL